MGFDPKGAVCVTNPISSDHSILRPSMLPSFLKAIRYNLHRGQKGLCFFEIGKVYTRRQELDTVAIALTGPRSSDWRHSEDGSWFDFYDLKGVVEQLVMRMAGRAVTVTPNDELSLFKIKSNQSVSVMHGAKKLGVMGAVHEDILNAFNIKLPVVFAQLHLKVLLKQFNKVPTFSPISDFPAVIRDVSLAVPETIHFDDLKRVAFDKGEPLLADVWFKELYLGDKIPEAHRGLIFSLKYQVHDRTLTEDEVQVLHDAIVEEWKSRYNVIQR
jgi:phenylalanyl-tRNA synthetase beta chain